MTIRFIEGGGFEDKFVASTAKAQPDFFSKIKGSIYSKVASENPLRQNPSIEFYEEDIQKILECYTELLPFEEPLSTIEEVISKLSLLSQEIKNQPRAPESEKKAEAITKIVQTICRSGTKSFASQVINPKTKTLATKRVVVVSCLNDLSNVFRFISCYIKDVNPLMNSIRMSIASTSFSSLLIAVDDFKKLLEAYKVKDQEGILQESIAVLMDLDRSGVGFSFLIGQAARLAVAAGDATANQLESSSSQAGYYVMGAFYALLGVRGLTRLHNLFRHRKEMGIEIFEPKDLQALKFFQAKLEISYSKVYKELQMLYGEKNLNDFLKKEAREQAKTIYLSIKRKGKPPGLEDFVDWGRNLLKRETAKEKADIDKFSLNIALASEKENLESFRALIEFSKMTSECPQLAELDLEGLMGLSVVCSRMESRINEELSRLTDDKSVLKVQKYAEDLLKKGKRVDEKSLTAEELEEARELSKNLRSAYWQKVRESSGLLLMTGLGFTIMTLTGPLGPIITVSCAAFLSAFKAYGYDYKKMQKAIDSLDPLKPYDKAIAWSNFGIGAASAIACGVVIGASIASFGALPIAVAAVVVTVWIVGSCYDLYKIHEREKFWNENEQIWKGETIQGQTVRVDFLPKSLGGRVHNITHNEFSERIEKIALHKIKEATLSKEKRQQAIDSFKSKNSVFQINLEAQVTDADYAVAYGWFSDMQNFLREEEETLNNLLSKEVDSLVEPAVSRESSGEISVKKDGEVALDPVKSDILIDSTSDVSIYKLDSAVLDSGEAVSSLVPLKRLNKFKSPAKMGAKASFPVPPNLVELQKKIEKTKAHIMRLEEQRQKTKSAGAGRQKRASLNEQIVIHQKQLEKLESKKN